MNGFFVKFIFVGILAVVGSLHAQEEQDPELEGRKLSHWRGYLLEGRYDARSFLREEPDYAMNVFRNAGAIVVPSLVQLLKHESTVARLNAAATLKRMGPEARSAVPALIKALDDEVPGVQAEVCDALQAIGIEAKPALVALAEMLDATEMHVIPPHAVWRVSDHARDALVAIGSESIPVFIKRIHDKSDIIRYGAIKALEQFPNEFETTVPELLIALDDKEPYVRSAAAGALGKFGTRARPAIPALMKHLSDEGKYGIGIYNASSVAADVVRSVRSIGATEKQLPELIARFQKAPEYSSNRQFEPPTFELHEELAYTIGSIGQSARPALPALAAALDDEHLRCVAAVAMLQISPDHQQARKVLLKEISDARDASGCLAAIDVVRTLNWTDRDTVTALQGCVRNPGSDVFLRLLAICTLMDLDPRSDEWPTVFKRDLTENEDLSWFSWPPDDRNWAILAAAIGRNPTAAKIALPVAIEQYYFEIDRSTAGAVIKAAGKHAGEVTTKVIEQLSDERVAIRELATRILGELGLSSAPAVPHLVRLLQDPRPVVRAAAADSLGEIGVADELVIGRMLGLLTDDYTTVRVSVLNALAKFGTKARWALPRLGGVKADKSKPVRDAATRAIDALSK